MKKLLLAMLLFVPLAASAATHYAAPGAGSGCNTNIGWASGTGTEACPWTLGVALNGGAGGVTVAAGDTVNLRGAPTVGSYSGCFSTNVQGTAGAPIIYQSYPGEFAQINGQTCATTGYQVLMSGSYYQFRNIRFYAGGTDRNSAIPGSFGTDIEAAIGLFVEQSGSHPGLKVINCLIDNTAEGIGAWVNAADMEVYGNIIIYNGWNAPDRSHGHGIYVQNNAGLRKIVKDNIIGYNASHGLHHYGSSQSMLQDVDYIGNASVGNKFLIPGGGDGRAALFTDPTNITVDDNLFFCRTNMDLCGQSETRLGYNTSSTNSRFRNNLVYTPLYLSASPQVNLTMTGNTIFSNRIFGFTTGEFPTNTYITAFPGTDVVVVRPNTYSPGRCNVYLMNFDGNTSASVNLSTCGMADGTNYEIRSAYNYVAGSFQTGTFAVASPTITVDLSDYAMSTPAGFAAVVQNGEYMMVVLPVTGGAPTATPTITSTFTRSNTPSVTNTASLTPTWTASNTPSKTPTNAPPTNTATPTFTPVPGQCLYIEAENATLVPSMAISADALASNLQFVQSDTANTGTATFSVDGGAGGTVYLWQRIISPDGNRDSFFTCLNDEGGSCAGDTTHVDDTAESSWVPSWQWSRVVDRAIAGCSPPQPLNPAACQRAFVLNAGANTIRFRARESFTKLDRLCVATDQVMIPSDQPTATPTATPTSTPTLTPSFTPSPTLTPTLTWTVGGPTATNTNTPSQTFTVTKTSTVTQTQTPTQTRTKTNTRTPTLTPTGGQDGPVHHHFCHNPTTRKSWILTHRHPPPKLVPHSHPPLCGGSF